MPSRRDARGLPLLAPWANRLSGRRLPVGPGEPVDLDGVRLPVDDNGLPIHGLLVGRPGWTVDRLTTRGETARLRASIERGRARVSVSASHRGDRNRAGTRARASTRRSCRPAGERCRSRSAGIRTSDSRARGGANGGCGCRRGGICARRSRDPDRRIVAVSRARTTRSHGGPSTTDTAWAATDGFVDERTRRGRRAAVRRRLSVRAGVGAARQAVRGAGADDRADELARRRHLPDRRSRRLVHGNVHVDARPNRLRSTMSTPIEDCNHRRHLDSGHGRAGVGWWCADPGGAVSTPWVAAYGTSAGAGRNRRTSSATTPPAERREPDEADSDGGEDADPRPVLHGRSDDLGDHQAADQRGEEGNPHAHPTARVEAGQQGV